MTLTDEQFNKLKDHISKLEELFHCINNIYDNENDTNDIVYDVQHIIQKVMEMGGTIQDTIYMLEDIEWKNNK